MTKRSNAPARALAVLALIGGFILLIAVFSAAMNSGDSTGSGKGTTSGKVGGQPAGNKNAPKAYVIKNGDTLTAIAHDTGVSVATIERLNPTVDPQILISGEKLKLR
jgi:LysM repeat protein